MRSGHRSDARAIVALGLALLAAPSASRGLAAADVDFDPSGTSLGATDVQAALEEIDAILLGDVAHVVTTELPEPIRSVQWFGGLWDTTLPVATRWYFGPTAGGADFHPKTNWCLSFNVNNKCGGGRLEPTRPSLNFATELGYKASPTSFELIENNVNILDTENVRYRPWAFHMNDDLGRAKWHVEVIEGTQGFDLHRNGHVVIGPDFGVPTYHLDVSGDALLFEDLDVEQDLAVTGRLIRRSSSAAYGPLLWGRTDVAALDTGDEVCEAAGYACVAVHATTGTPASCGAVPAGPRFYARCLSTNIAVCEDLTDGDGDGVPACDDNCPLDANGAAQAGIPGVGDQDDTDGDGAGDACDADDDDDGLPDDVETDTGLYVDASDTGTDPRNADTDGDGFPDGDEVALGSDPNDPFSIPALDVPALPVGGLVVLGLLLGGTGLRRTRAASRDAPV